MQHIIDQMHRKVHVPNAPQRIISLVPSQTELLHDLGLGKRVVGITKFCIHPESWFRSKTRIGGTKKLDIDKIRALKPDLIIGNKEENERKEILALEQEFPVWISDVRDLPGALEMIAAIGEITGTLQTAREINTKIQQRFGELTPLDPSCTVAYFIWRNPYMVAGHGTFVNDMLKRCGLINVFDADDARYPEITDQDIEEADPELILLSSEPYPFKEEHLADLQAICPEASIRIVDGEPFSWYGSRLLHAPDYFKRVLYG